MVVNQQGRAVPGRAVLVQETGLPRILFNIWYLVPCDLLQISLYSLADPGPRAPLTGGEGEERNTQSAPSKIQRREWLQVWEAGKGLFCTAGPPASA